MNAVLRIVPTAPAASPASPAPVAAAAIARRNLLVDLRVSLYSGRRKDRATQEEVQHAKGAASRRAASVYKSLFAECAELETITSIQNRARRRHYAMTAPWSDTGTRLLPLVGLKAYMAEMRNYQQHVKENVEQILSAFDWSATVDE